MRDVMNAQTVLDLEDVQKLKDFARDQTTKGALRKAVEFYIEFEGMKLDKGSLKKLKDLTGEKSTKDAITKAVKYYIECHGGKSDHP